MPFLVGMATRPFMIMLPVMTVMPVMVVLAFLINVFRMIRENLSKNLMQIRNYTCNLCLLKSFVQRYTVTKTASVMAAAV